jgi:hypothetical protein
MDPHTWRESDDYEAKKFRQRLGEKIEPFP